MEFFMKKNNLRAGFIMTPREIKEKRAFLSAMQDIKDNRKKFWKNQITDEDIAYMKKAMEAPDINLFLKCI